MPNPAYQAARAVQSREKILNAALALFVERGFDAVGLKDIALAADVSTATLFKHFPQKEALLSGATALLADMRDEGAAIPDQSLEDSLKTIGQSYARRLDHPMLLGLARLGVTLGDKVPGLGTAVNDAWRKPFAARLEGVMERSIASAEVTVPDMTVAVRQFFGLITDALLWRRLLSLGGPAEPSYRIAVVDEAVKTFLARYKN